MLRWLRRPWGIVTVADIDRAFRGLAPDDKQDEVPRAFSVLTPMLQTEVEDHLASKFGVSTPQRARASSADLSPAATAFTYCVV